MKLTANRAALAAALAPCARLIENRSTIAITKHVLVEASDGHITLTGSDLNTEIVSGTAADVAEEGRIAVLADKLAKAIDKAGGDLVHLSILSNGSFQIRSGATRIQVPCMSPADFPYLEANDFSPAFAMAGEDFTALMGACLPSVSTEETRSYLCGVHIHSYVPDEDGARRQISFVATNGHTMMLVRQDVEDDAPGFPALTLTAKAANEAVRLAKGAITVEASARIVRFTFASGIVMMSKVVDGVFPDYMRVLPKRAAGCVVSTEMLMAAIGRVAVADEGRENYTRIDVRGNLIVMDREVRDSASVYDEVPCEGDVNMTFALAHPYLSMVLKSLGSDMVEISYAGRGNPIGFWRATGSSSIGDATAVIMPIELKGHPPAKPLEE